MTRTEIRAARMHLVQGEKVEHIMAACHMSKQEVLHAIAQYSAEYRHIPSECDFFAHGAAVTDPACFLRACVDFDL